MSATVKGFLLSNGGTVYATVDRDTHNQYTLKQPVTLQVRVTPDQQQFLVPVPFLPMMKDGSSLLLEKAHVVAAFEVSDDLVTAYQEATGSIITPPTQSIILG